jgi:outer membrane protein TolC
MNRGAILFFGILLLCTGVVFAQSDPQSLSISEAMEYSVKNNKNIQNARNEVRLAELQIKESFSAGYPQFSAGMDYMTNFNYEVEFEFGGTTSDPPVIDFTKLDAGDVEVLGVIDQMFGSSEPATIKMGDQLSANFQVSQLLFSGQFWVGLELAKIGRSLAEKSIVLTEIDLKEQVVNTYNMILVSEKLLDVMEQNEQKMIEIQQHTQNLFNAGMAEQTDVDQLTITLSQLKNGIRAMERNIEISYNLFRFVLGLEKNSEVRLTTTLDQLMDDLVSQNLLEAQFDLADNPTYQLLKEQEFLNEKMVTLQKWAYAPTLLGFYSYTEKLISSGFNLSPNHAAGISLSVPIWDGGATKIQVSRARVELDKVRIQTALLSDQLSLQNEQARYDIQSSFEEYTTQKENVEVAKRVLSSYENKYQQGVISSLELTQANVNYLQAENNYVSSIMSLLQAKLAMDKLYNKL